MKMFEPLPRILLMVGDDGVIVVPHNIADAVPFFVPTNDKLFLQKIAEFASLHPQVRITLFADNLSQDYRREDLPPLNIFDRKKLIARRLKQTFPSARLSAYLRFKNDPKRVLMIGLHESNPVFVLADKLRERLPDIALLPVEGARLMARLMPEAEDGWAMMVSRQKSGGFRQIVTFNDDLVFTRLTPLPLAGSGNEAEIIARDIKASLDYLARLGLHGPKELSVLLLMPEDAHKNSAFEALSLKSVHSVSPSQATELLGLPLTSLDDTGSADILYAEYFLGRLRPIVSLMLPEMKKAWLTQTIQFWGLRMAYVCLVFAGLLTLWRAGDLTVTLYQMQKEAVRAAKTHYVLAREQALAAPLTEPLGRMRQALERRHIYEQPTLMPWLGLNELANGLDQNSKVVRLEWKNSAEGIPEKISITLRIISDAPPDNRSAIVALFSRIVQNIAQVMPDFSVTGIKPPYPALPQETVTPALILTEEPVGEITLERKSP